MNITKKNLEFCMVVFLVFCTCSCFASAGQFSVANGNDTIVADSTTNHNLPATNVVEVIAVTRRTEVG